MTVREQTLEALEESPFGRWDIKMSEGSQTFSITVSHPLSKSLTMVFLLDDATMNLKLIHARVDSAGDEFAILADAPDVRHAGLIGDVRRAAGSAGWPAEVVSTLAKIMERHDLLTADEAAWLSSAGPARWEALDSDVSIEPF